MRWFKKNMWKVDIALIGLFFFLVITVWVPMAASAHEEVPGLAVSGPSQVAPTVDVTATITALNEEKLKQEIQQLKNQNGNQSNWLANNSTALIAAAATVIVTLFGILQWAITVRQAQDKESRDRDLERRKEVVTQDKELRDRENERQKEIALQDKELVDRAEERFKTAVAALGDKNEATQVGGAILLRSFLNKDDKEIYGRYYTQIFDLAVAYLRLSNKSQPSSDNTPMSLTSFRHALVVILRESYLLVRDILMGQIESKFDPRLLDASRVSLDGAYLVESDLKHIWMIDASLIDVRLGRANLHKADLRRANIIRTFLNRADLSEATLFQAIFDGSDLSGADLRGADLRGVKFNETILTNANLSGADLGELTVRGENIRAANPEDAQFLEGTDLRGVKGLTRGQLEACRAKGAIIDEDTTSDSFQPPASPSAQSQNSSTQAAPVEPAQVIVSPVSTDRSSTSSQ